MIFISTADLLSAAKQAFLKLDANAQGNTSDPAILYEAAAAIEVSHPLTDKPAWRIEGGKFRYVDNYDSYFPYADEGLVVLEQEHYTEILIASGLLDTAVHHLQMSPASRRHVANVWQPEHSDAQRTASPCLTQLVFRINNGTLDIHAHFRANNAFQLLLMDMQLAVSVGHEVAERIDVPLGTYIHFVDSLHFYHQHADAINKQKAFFKDAPIWQGR